MGKKLKSKQGGMSSRTADAEGAFFEKSYVATAI
jgi:hypothetical protein